MAIQVNNGVDAVANYSPMIQQVAELGANSVLFCVAGYMEHARAQAIFIEARRAPSVADMTALVREAHSRNMQVILMPMVLLKHPRGSEWRGVIEPPDWKQWWNEYREFINYFARMATAAEVDVLMVGSELVSTEKYTAEWEKIIAEVRWHYPKGKLGYSANWDHYKPVKFWDKLDLISMTSYYTLASRDNPPVEEIIDYWRPIQAEIMSWARQVGKPVMLSEVGWCSQEGAARAPWNYYQNQNATPQGHEEQRRLYEAFLKVWDGTPGMAGVVWWEWTPSEGGAKDYGYTPRNKPAEKILRAWFAAGGEAASPASQPAE